MRAATLTRSLGLLPRLEVDRVHGLPALFLEDSGDASDPNLPKVVVKDVPPVSFALHPGLEAVVGRT